LDNANRKSSVRFARTTALPGVELMTAHANSHAWRVYHEQYAVCTGDTAAADIRYRRRSHRIIDRSTLLFEPGETHETLRVTRPQDFQVIFLTPGTIRRYSEEMEMHGQPHFKPAPNIDEQVFLSFKRLHAAILEDETEIEQQSRLAECVGMLLTSHAEQRVPLMPSPGKLPLLSARDFLHDRYADSVSLEEIAAIAGLSRFHFLKVFTELFGLTPHAYQICLRIERSLPLLRQGMSLAHIAETMGFYDQSHFIRHFKRTMGVTPRQYQERR
jgi:AraC-like DNA-binding protein